MPLADPVEQQLLPSKVSRLPVNLNGPRAFIFKDEDGTDVLHFLGDFTLTLGEQGGQKLRSRDAVVWITHQEYQEQIYRQLQILLFRDAQVRGAADTVTSGPVLFVTLNTSGEIKTDVDDVAFQPYVESQAYRQGVAIRRAITQSDRTIGTESALHVFDPSRAGGRSKPAKVRPVVQIRSEGEMKSIETADGHFVVTVVGGVFLSRSEPGSRGYVEISADSVVVFLPRLRSSGEPRGSSPGGSLAAGLGDLEVEAAYLEGDVVLSQGLNKIRASRLYYDFVDDRALILDAVVHATMLKRNIPLYLRAAEIRQLSRRQYTATDAVLTTSEFFTPHYHVGARRVELTNLTPADPAQGQEGIRTGSFRIDHATLNLGGHPIAYWPLIRGNLDTSETAIKNVRTGFSDEFGLEFETEWHLFNILGLETPDGFDATLSLDFFSERGPMIGADAVYQRDNYFGLLRSSLLSDIGRDFLGRERVRPSERDARGRFLLRHRHYLDNDWQLTLEASYISDEGFLEEFFELEFDNEKEQETLLYLKKQRDDWAFTMSLQARLLDFVTQTERLPELSFQMIGRPLGEFATLYSENRAGELRYRSAHQSFLNLLLHGRKRASGLVARADTRQEIGMPIDLGPVRLVPFVAVRGTGWDDSPRAGGMVRAFGTAGVRGSMYLSRLYPDVRSSMFDLEGVRHIIKPDIVAWVSHANRDPDELFPFDETVEGIDEVDGVMIGLRQRWQTKRGGVENRRTVDFLTLDTEVGLFSGAAGGETTNGFTSFSRPENSISRNYANVSLIYRVNDRTALLGELNYDLNDGEVDILNLSLAVERLPRFSYMVGYRLIEESDSELLGFDLNYRLAEKHTLALRERFDLERGRSLDFTLALIRRFPRWFGAISFALDEAEDDFGVSVSIWPEGLPQAALGSRRFTGLAGTTRLRN